MTPIQVYPESREDWLAWRKTGLGSSHAAIIMNASPWQTPRELWSELTGRTPPQDTSWIMQKGIDEEPKARAAFELINDLDLPPACLEHPEHRWMHASLDGYNAEKKRILEIKFLGMGDSWRATQEGKISEHYTWQLVHQMMVADAESADFYGWNGFEGKHVPFKRDRALEFRLFEAERAFWGLIQSDAPPPLTDRDYLELDDPAAVEAFTAWRLLKTSELQTPEQRKQMEEMREEMRRFLVHPKVECAGVRMLTVQRKGGPTVELRLKQAREAEV